MARRSNASIDMEVAAIQAQLELLERREEEFEKLVLDMKRLTESWAEEKRTLTAKALELEAQRHPIHWLPSELLAQIFLAAADYDDDDYSQLDEWTVFHHPSVTISHVCQRWRDIATTIPSLWSYLAYNGVQWQEDLRPTFINRSGDTPLHIIYRARPEDPVSNERRKVTSLFDDLAAHLERVQSIALQCGDVRTIECVVEVLSSASYKFPLLRSLQLSIITPNVSFTRASSLLDNNRLDTEPQFSSMPDIWSWSNLKHLELREVPLFNLPTHFFANLTTLILTFHPRKTISRMIMNRYRLRMSSLCSFLEFTPKLEDLTLSNTVPYFDTALQGGTNVNPPIKMRPRVPLLHLKKFDWSYPYTQDVHEFFSFIDTPALEKIDFWVETDRGDYVPRRPAIPATPPEYSVPAGYDFPLLRELSLQCTGDEITSTALRKFALPVLEKFELINADVSARTGDLHLPPVPRLEFIFRDPRLPHLTHLTLSHFEIPYEPWRTEAMLGYMPALTSLSLDTCTGVRTLIMGLTAKAVGTFVHTPEGTKIRRQVKFCPRFESLSLWSCDDVNFDDLCALVIARNRQTDEEIDRDSSDVPPNASDGSRSGNEAEKSPSQAGRAIKPLRKSRLIHPTAVSGSDCTPTKTLPSPSTNLWLAIREVSHPANIVFIRMEDCPSITCEEAIALKDLGVVDVVYRSDSECY